MSFGKKLFGFQGRLRRRDWWLLTLLLIVAQWVVSSIALGATGGVFPGGMGGGMGAGMAGGWGGHWGPAAMGPGGAPFVSLMQRVLLIQVVTAAVFLWPSAAVSVKRLHDRNHTGWWLALPYVLAVARSGLMVAAFSRYGMGGFGPGAGMMGGGWRGQWGMMGGHWQRNAVPLVLRRPGAGPRAARPGARLAGRRTVAADRAGLPGRDARRQPLRRLAQADRRGRLNLLRAPPLSSGRGRR